MSRDQIKAALVLAALLLLLIGAAWVSIAHGDSLQ